MLGVLLQAASGMVSDDGAGFTGPLNEYVSSASGLLATALHKDVGQWLLLALVLLHVLAIAYYRIVKRKRLVQAMVGGDKLPAAAATRSVRDNAGTRALALTLFVGCLLVVNNLKEQGQAPASSRRRPSSSRTATPSSRALSSLLPASAPATT